MASSALSSSGWEGMAEGGVVGRSAPPSAKSKRSVVAPRAQPQGGLRAGSTDDNIDFDQYLSFLHSWTEKNRMYPVALMPWMSVDDDLCGSKMPMAIRFRAHKSALWIPVLNRWCGRERPMEMGDAILSFSQSHGRAGREWAGYTARRMGGPGEDG